MCIKLSKRNGKKKQRTQNEIQTHRKKKRKSLVLMMMKRNEV